jgi:hypothetical protein
MYASDTIDAEQLLQHLHPGVYRVCVTSPPHAIYAEGSTCRMWTQSGSARELLRFGQIRQRLGRLRIPLHPAAALIGWRATVHWRRADCTTCRPIAGTIIFRRNTVLTAPSRDSHQAVTLAVAIPRVTVHGVPFVAAIVRRRFRD